VFAGPAGTFDIPCSAVQGLIGFCLAVAVLIALIVVATVRWKRRAVRL
jgi:hypothetical protein